MYQLKQQNFELHKLIENSQKLHTIDQVVDVLTNQGLLELGSGMGQLSRAAGTRQNEWAAFKQNMELLANTVDSSLNQLQIRDNSIMIQDIRQL